MSKYVPDILSRRWVIISDHRVNRPEDNFAKKKKNICVFCPGNEALTPMETFRIGKGDKGKPGWDVRVIPNKYPITDLHEVIIHSPEHDKDIDTLPLGHVVKLFQAYRDRFIYYKKRGQVLIFCNHGEHSGASMVHPHSQLVVIPSQINLDTLTQEPLNNIVETNKFFYVYCPDFSQWPYETWIAPKSAFDNNNTDKKKIFSDITDTEITDLAEIFQKTLKSLKKIAEKNKLTINTFSYNYYIYPKENWYLRIIPRLVHRAGFELGTGLSVNVVDPTSAASEIRGVEDKLKNVLTKLKHF
jgi:UDPglucose--hexose-1-phosphate uridylyltransferase